MSERVPVCAGCGSTLAHDQRYCLRCGERRGPLPARLGLEAPPLEPAATPVAETGGLPFPGPRAAAVAVMAMLSFGVLIGSAFIPAADSAPAMPLIVSVAAPAAPVPTAAPTAVPEPAPAPAPVAAAPVTPAPVVQQQIVQPPPVPAVTPLPPAPTGPQLPPVKHVFMIVLSDHGYDAAFGPTSTAPYLAKTLTKQGKLLANYYAVTSGGLANAIALMSGQGPNPDIAANCPTYGDAAPDGTSGCVFPSQVTTLPDALVASGYSWKAYVEDVDKGPAGSPTTCRHPDPGTADPNGTPRPGDAYVTWRNPFVYFHSILDGGSCASSDVGLGQLTTDLATARTTPAFSYIVPNRCHDGAEEPCAPDAPAGLPAADAFLAQVVPAIEQSPAYKDGGLIAITFDQAPKTGSDADSSACCTEPAYANLPPAATPTATPTPDPAATPTPAPALPPGADTATGGGGRVGLLLISPFVKAGTVNVTTSFNHFTLLRSIEDLFGLQPTGYAADPGLLPFDQVVYDGKSSG